MTILPKALYTAAQTRELDRLAIAAGTPGAELMARAGQAAFDTLCERWPEARQIAVLCGGGNNGGDGYVVARLAHAAGLAPQIHFTTPPEKLKGDALTMAERCREAGIPMTPLTLDRLPEEVDLLVDSLLGTGLSGVLRDEMAACAAPGAGYSLRTGRRYRHGAGCGVGGGPDLYLYWPQARPADR